MIEVPTYAPLPFCDFSILDIEYELTTGRNASEIWQEPWLSFDKESHELKISILTSDFAPTKDHQVCIVATLQGTDIKKVECFKVMPEGYDPTDPSNYWEDVPGEDDSGEDENVDQN